MIASSTGRETGIPSFFIKALISLRELTPSQIHINQVTSANEAKAEPIWYSWLFSVPNDFHDTWRRHLQLNRVDDLVYDYEQAIEQGISGREFITNYLRQALHTFGNHFRTSTGRLVPIKSLINQYEKIYKSVPQFLTDVAIGETPERYPFMNQTVLKMMSSMGWTGGGLGRRGQGIAEPIKPDESKMSKINHRTHGPINFVPE